jgi:transcriptional regulator with XRE-family HTH domain
LRTLTELRIEEGLRQQDLAEELAVSQANISRIERQADPRVSTLMRYLGALGANLELRAVIPDRSVQLYFLESDVVEEAATDGTGSRQQQGVERALP